ncbi:g444 [Coccomyxa elongata]
MASTPADVAGEGAKAHPDPGNPSQVPGDGHDVHMEEAQEQASPDEGESDYHVSEVLAAEARAASERAEGERLAQIAEENDVPLIMSSELWEDAGLPRGRFLRSLIIAAVHKQAPIEEPVLRVALADFASAIQELMKRVQSLEVNLHAANDLVETLRREVAVLKNRFSGRPGLPFSREGLVGYSRLAGYCSAAWLLSFRLDRCVPMAPARLHAGIHRRRAAGLNADDDATP